MFKLDDENHVPITRTEYSRYTNKMVRVHINRVGTTIRKSMVNKLLSLSENPDILAQVITTKTIFDPVLIIDTKKNEMYVILIDEYLKCFGITINGQFITDLKSISLPIRKEDTINSMILSRDNSRTLYYINQDGINYLNTRAVNQVNIFDKTDLHRLAGGYNV